MSEDANNIEWRKAVISIVFSVAIGFYAGWLLANTGFFYVLVFLITVVSVAYNLYRKKSIIDVVSWGFYTLAIFVAVTPVFFYIPILISGVENPWIFFLNFTDFILWLPTLLMAGIIAGVGYGVRRFGARRLS